MKITANEFVTQALELGADDAVEFKIDVFATVRKFDLPLETLTDEDQEQNWYSAVFVE